MKARATPYLRFLLMLFAITTQLSSSRVLAKENDTATNYNTNYNNEYEDILVVLKVKTLGNYNFNVVYSQDKIFFPLPKLFELLEIDHKYDTDQNIISGIYNNTPYVINFSDKLITVNTTALKIPEDYMVALDAGLLVESESLANAFGFKIDFNFNGLYIDFEAPFELPALKKRRLQKSRTSIQKTQEPVTPDTIYSRRFHKLRGGVANYLINVNQLNGKYTGLNAKIMVGTELLGGETHFNYDYNSNTDISFKHVNFNWRLANDDNKYIKQFELGTLRGSRIANISSLIIGATISNASIRQQHIYGETIISNFAKPNSTVEIYINDILADYLETDASGYYAFNIPMSYGNSDIKLKFYNTTGEDPEEEYVKVNIPNNLIPKKSFQYILSNGMVTKTSAFFSHGEFNYSFNRHFAIKGGAEYLTSLQDKKFIPFAGIFASPNANLFGNIEYIHNVGTLLMANYKTNSQYTFNFSHEQLKPDQQVVSKPYIARSRLVVSTPFFIKKTRVMMQTSLERNKTIHTKNSTIQTNLSFTKNRFSFRFASFTRWGNQEDMSISGNLTTAYKLPKNMSLRGNLASDIRAGKLQNYNMIFEKKFRNGGEFQLAYQGSFLTDDRSISVSYRNTVNKIASFFSTTLRKDEVITTEGMNGSLLFDELGTLRVSQRAQIGSGSLALIPFIDVNHNGIRDGNEPLAPGLNVRIDDRIVRTKEKDTIVKIEGLIPHISNILTLDDTSFDNIYWKIKQKTLQVYIDPNQYKNIYVPVSPMGEIYGYIYYDTNNKLNGARGILINIHDEEGNKVGETMTESDGYYAYIGLKPGKHTVSVNETQLQNLNREVITKQPLFSIEESYDGFSKGLPKIILFKKEPLAMTDKAW